MIFHRWLCFLPVVAMLAAPVAHATPGPDSTVTLVNTQATGSAALEKAYAEQRFIPKSQRCSVSVPPFDDVTLEVFSTQILAPLVACLTENKSLDRVEAIVLMRGMPRRVHIDPVAGAPVVSLAAALMVARSTLADDKTPLVGQTPGYWTACGGSADCFAAKWANPYDKLGPFDAGFATTTGNAHHRLWLVTALDAYSYEDAGHLTERAILAEQKPDVAATWLLMQGAGKARQARDFEYEQVAKKLQIAGAKPDNQKFDANYIGKQLGAFVTGTAGIGKTIEGNTYVAGTLTDNLTSFGAVPMNFTAPEDKGAESQVSICRWVRAGVTGAHGTVAEPLANSFPSRYFLVDYRQGATLAESYLRNMPFVYWMNLVLGDPMAAPYATRPQVDLQCKDGWLGQTNATCTLAAEATMLPLKADGNGEEINRLRAFLPDGSMVEAQADSLQLPLAATTVDQKLTIVAQFAAGTGAGGSWRSKGWRQVTLHRLPPVGGKPLGDTTSGKDGSGAADAAVAASGGGSGAKASGCEAGAVGQKCAAVVLLPLLAWCWRRRRASA